MAGAVDPPSTAQPSRAAGAAAPGGPATRYRCKAFPKVSFCLGTNFRVQRWPDLRLGPASYVVPHHIHTYAALFGLFLISFSISLPLQRLRFMIGKLSLTQRSFMQPLPAPQRLAPRCNASSRHLSPNLRRKSRAHAGVRSSAQTLACNSSSCKPHRPKRRRPMLKTVRCSLEETAPSPEGPSLPQLPQSGKPNAKPFAAER